MESKHTSLHASVAEEQHREELVQTWRWFKELLMCMRVLVNQLRVSRLSWYVMAYRPSLNKSQLPRCHCSAWCSRNFSVCDLQECSWTQLRGIFRWVEKKGKIFRVWHICSKDETLKEHFKQRVSRTHPVSLRCSDCEGVSTCCLQQFEKSCWIWI